MRHRYVPLLDADVSLQRIIQRRRHRWREMATSTSICSVAASSSRTSIRRRRRSNCPNNFNHLKQQQNNTMNTMMLSSSLLLIRLWMTGVNLCGVFGLSSLSSSLYRSCGNNSQRQCQLLVLSSRHHQPQPNHITPLAHQRLSKRRIQHHSSILPWDTSLHLGASSSSNLPSSSGRSTSSSSSSTSSYVPRVGVDDTTSAGSGKRNNYSYNLILSEEQQQQPSIMNELNHLHTLLSQCLAQDYSYYNNNNDIDEQPILHILHTMMIIYTKWCTTMPYPSSQLRYKVSSAIDISFRLVTNMAFSTTSSSTSTTVSWINIGLEAMQLQLYSKYMTIIDVMNNSNENDSNKYNNSTTSIIEGGRIKEGDGSGSSSSNMKLISLQRPYDTIHKGTWLRALRALTSKDMYSSSSSSSALQIRVLSSYNSEFAHQMITPANAAYRILQRLINGRGIRRSTTNYNKRKKEDGSSTKTQQQTQQQQQQQQVVLDERDFNMVLQAYAMLSIV
jgi:hypothetical protein